ncbi:MAG: SIR2 family protein [Methanomicrobiaceae archaeon]|nr:SIR2 family protein [Methanomicrobiaceae archaeon]
MIDTEEKNDFSKKLVDFWRKFNNLPFLFVGSGISQRYISSENWEGLLKLFVEEMAKHPYGYYSSKADKNLPKIASLISVDYHEFWFEKNHKIASIYEKDMLDISSPLKIAISEYLKEREIKNEPESLKNELLAFSKANFDGIITTNYDLLLEHIFPNYKVYIGQENLLFSETHKIGEIYKIHGCCSKPNSLVLCENDYQNFNEKSQYLAAKLMTIFVEHPVIFMGYSINDTNIQNIISSIVKCLSNQNIDSLKNRLIFVKRDKNYEGNLIFDSIYQVNEKITLPIKIIRTNDFKLIYDSLTKINRKIPAHILRMLKDQFYSYALSTDPNISKKINVGIEFDQIHDKSDIEFYAGIGIVEGMGKYGYLPLKRQDLFEDILFNTYNYEPENVLKYTIPQVSKLTKNIPIFKYLKISNRISGNILDTSKLEDSVINIATTVNFQYFRSQQFSKKFGKLEKKSSIKELIDSNDNDYHTIHLIPFLDANNIDLDELKKYLIEKYSDLEDDNSKISKYNSQYFKLICFYDWLKYTNGKQLIMDTNAN